MSFTLILGPMKSGKSLELIARISALEHSNLSSVLVQPNKNVREDNVKSRLGVELDAIKVDSLKEVDVGKYDVIGVDEVFMFPDEDADVIKSWLHNGKQVLVSSLDLSAMGRIPSMVCRLYRLGPDEVTHKYSICESCRNPGAQFSQILKNGEVVRDLPDVVPEDGTYDYRPVCRKCYFA